MDLAYQFILDYGTEVVFLKDGEQRIFDIRGVNSFSEIYKDDPKVIEQLELARIALFNAAAMPERETLN